MRVAFLKTLLIVLPLLADASYYMGGELAWECLPNGRYRFILTAYRECYTLSGGATPTYGPNQTIYSSGGGISSFQVSRIAAYPEDISPQCNSNPSFPRITCQGMMNGSNFIGAVEKHVFTSDLLHPTGVQLIGVPPPQGWVFSWRFTCCRPHSTNIAGATNQGWSVQAKMFNYNNQNAFPCFSNSPQFAETPITAFCAAYPHKLDFSVTNPDYDSIMYEWDIPMKNDSTGVTYSSGYSFNNPLPGITQNPNNIPAIPNQFVGLISFTSFTTGSFVVKLKAVVWRCGIKLSEVSREFQLTILPCLQSNTAPDIVNPFLSSGGVVLTYGDTVYTGENVVFNIAATDFQYLPNMQQQTVSLYTRGDLFAPDFTSTTGCKLPPCATLNPPPPLSQAFVAQTQFRWQVHCSHLYNPYNRFGCGVLNNTYEFLVKAHDDFCPVPSYNYQYFSLVVMPDPNPLQPLGPVLNCVTYINDTTILIEWHDQADSINIFHSYDIYASDNLGGPYTLIDSIMHKDTLSYIYRFPQTLPQPENFFMRKRSFCTQMQHSFSSDTIRKIELYVTHDSLGNVYANWNAPGIFSPVYLVKHSINSGLWHTIDTIYWSPTYTEFVPPLSCIDTVRYYVEAHHPNMSCVLVSDIVEIIIDRNPYVSIGYQKNIFCDYESPHILTLFPSGGVLSGSGTSGASFYPQLSDTGLVNITYSYTNSLGCTGHDTAVFNVRPPPQVSISGLDTAYCAGDANVTVIGIPSGGNFSNIILLNTFSPSLLGVGLYNVIYEYTDTFGCYNTDSVLVRVNPHDVLSVSGIPPLICDNSPPVLLSASPSGGVFTGNGISANFFMPINAGAGNHNINYSYTNIYSCHSDTDIVISVLPAPNVELFSPQYGICLNAGALTLTGSPAGGVYIGNGISGNVFDPSVSGVGTFTVSYEYTDNNGCSSSDSKDIDVYPLPLVDAGPDTAKACLDSAIVIGGMWEQGVSYHWTPVNGLSSAVIPNPHASPNISTIYQLVGINSLGCSDTSGLAFIILDAPDVYIGEDTTLCFGESIELDAGPMHISYIWNSGEQNRYLLVAPAQQSTFIVTVSDGNCLNADTITIGIANPYVKLGNDTTICAGDTIILDAGINEGYLWQSGDTTRYFEVVSQSPLPSGIQYSVVVREKHCYMSDSINIAFRRPNIYLGGDTSICKGDLFYIDPGLSYASYLWSNGSNRYYWMLDPAADTGTYIVSLFVSDYLGCVNSDSLKLEVKNCSPAPVNTDNWELLIYPNPNKGRFSIWIKGAHPLLNISIFDARGREVRTFVLLPSSHGTIIPADLYGHAAGVYVTEAKSDKKTEAERFVIE